MCEARLSAGNLLRNGCSPVSNLPHRLEIDIVINKINQTDKQSVWLRCSYNDCNNGKNLLALNSALKLYFDLSPMRRILGFYKEPTVGTTEPASRISSPTREMTTILKEQPAITTMNSVNQSSSAIDRIHDSITLITLALLLVLLLANSV